MILVQGSILGDQFISRFLDPFKRLAWRQIFLVTVEILLGLVFDLVEILRFKLDRDLENVSVFN